MTLLIDDVADMRHLLLSFRPVEGDFRRTRRHRCFSWLQGRRNEKAQIDAEARALIAEHGAGAYQFARTRALE
jgi:hypothetical protein